MPLPAIDCVWIFCSPLAKNVRIIAKLLLPYVCHLIHSNPADHYVILQVIMIGNSQ